MHNVSAGESSDLHKDEISDDVNIGENERSSWMKAAPIKIGVV